MKNIIVGLLSISIIALMVITFQRGGAFQGGEAGKIIEDMSKQKIKSQEVEQKSDREIEDDKLKALRDKAGNVGAFKVSQKYKSKCSSCHGVNGHGGMGKPVFGLSSEQVYKALVEFKSGRRENVIMKGLLIGLNDDDFKELAKEIGEFKARAEALK